ncbi:MAG: RDD family protein [Thermoplasmata archaeon]
MGTTGFDMLGNKALQDHWLRRLVAIIIDAIIVSIAVFILGIFLWFFGWFAWGWLGGGFLLFLYSIVLETAMGATIGKKIMSLKVVGVQEQLNPPMVLVRNVSKIVGILLIIDWIVGMLTPGDPRQKYTDRLIGCTIARTDERAYMEEQFKVAQFYRPPPAHAYQPYQQPYQAPQTGEQPSAEAKSEGWVRTDQPEPPGPRPRFCQNCGGPLNERPDGRMQCPACGRMY